MMSSASPAAPAAMTIPTLPTAQSIETRDGRILVGRLARPLGTAPRMAILLNGGTGVLARYYQDFAAWLAETHAAAVLIYDYRDFGWSQTRPLRQSDATLLDWGMLDQSAALSRLTALYPRLPLRVIGHSLGGQWLAFHDEIARVDRVVAVASGPVFWREHPWSYMPRVVAFWWLVGPLATKLLGYLPGKALGLGADIPAGVYWEWRKVCTTPGFHRSEWGRSLPNPRLDQARFDLTIMPVADDRLMPASAVRRLPTLYPHARASERMIDPGALGLGEVGHLSAFSSRNRACWPLIAAPLVD